MQPWSEWHSSRQECAVHTCWRQGLSPSCPGGLGNLGQKLAAQWALSSLLMPTLCCSSLQYCSSTWDPTYMLKHKPVSHHFWQLDWSWPSTISCRLDLGCREWTHLMHCNSRPGGIIILCSHSKSWKELIFRIWICERLYAASVPMHKVFCQTSSTCHFLVS